MILAGGLCSASESSITKLRHVRPAIWLDVDPCGPCSEFAKNSRFEHGRTLPTNRGTVPRKAAKPHPGGESTRVIPVVNPGTGLTR